MKAILTFLLLNVLWIGPIQNTGLDMQWKFKKEKNGIKVFVRNIANSNLKELKIEMSFENMKMAKIIDLLRKAERYKDWVFKCSESSSVKIISASEDISYYKFDFPWPLNDRDAYLRSVIEVADDQQSAVINTTLVSGYDVLDDGVIRIPNHFNQWNFTQVTDDQVDLVYYVKSNPGGSIPDWMVNLAVDKGPTETLNNLRKLLSR